MENVNVLDKSISSRMLLKFSLPTIASMIFMGIYSTVDGLFVSWLVGTDALSAINIVLPMLLFSIAVGTMFGAGGNALIARKIGAGKEVEARQNFTLIVLVTVIASVIISGLCMLFANPLLRLLGANDALLPMARGYAFPIMIFIPSAVLGMMFHMSFITAGKANLGFMLSMVGGLANIVLDYLFIKVWGTGVVGAAIATGIGYSIPGILGLIYFSVNHKTSLYLVKPKWDKLAIWQSCSNGASEMVTSLASAVVATLLNNILMRMAGSDGVAAITIILYAQSILGAAYMGYASGIAPIISFNYGKQDSDRLSKVYSKSLRMIAIASIITLGLSLIFATTLVGIFARPGTAVFDMAVHGFRIFSVSFLFMGFNAFSSSMFTALSNGRVSAILSFFRTLIFISVAAIALPLIFGLSGVWISIPVAEGLGLIMTAYYFKKMKSVYHYA